MAEGKEAEIKAENQINELNREREEEEAELEQAVPCATVNYSLCSFCSCFKNIFGLSFEGAGGNV